jgi:hypothetical protein
MTQSPRTSGVVTPLLVAAPAVHGRHEHLHMEFDPQSVSLLLEGAFLSFSVHKDHSSSPVNPAIFVALISEKQLLTLGRETKTTFPKQLRLRVSRSPAADPRTRGARHNSHEQDQAHRSNSGNASHLISQHPHLRSARPPGAQPTRAASSVPAARIHSGNFLQQLSAPCPCSSIQFSSSTSKTGTAHSPCLMRDTTS